jgi:hypothetical protein
LETPNLARVPGEPAVGEGRSHQDLINQATGQIEQYNARVENIAGIGIIEPVSKAKE